MSITSSAAKLPVTIITGFLGAGKTTLVGHLLSNARGRRLAVIVNEFGSRGVDGDLLKGCGIEACANTDIVELANGCLCCTVADDFVPTIEALLSRPNPPDHILIETSGLALPKPLIKAFNWPGVSSRLTVDGVVTVVDAPAVAAGRFADDLEAVARQRAEDPSLDHDNPISEVYEDQLGSADLVILNKTDLVDPAELERVSADIIGKLPRAVKLVSASEGRIDPTILLGLNAAAESDLDSRPSHHEAEGEDHEHDDFESTVLELPELGADPSAANELLRKLMTISEVHDILRVKGFLAVAGKPMRLAVQGVGHRFRHAYDRAWAPDERRSSHLVFIARKGLDRDAISEALAA